MFGHYTTGPAGVTGAEYSKAALPLQVGLLALLHRPMATAAAQP